MSFSKALVLCILMMLPAIGYAQSLRMVLFTAQDSLELAEAKRAITSFDPVMLIQSLSDFNTPEKVMVIQNQNSFLAWEDCNLNVYRWDHSQWSNTYKYNNYGYFCDGYPLVWNEQLHLLGGNGLVNYHSDFLIFEQPLGSWEFVPTKFQPLDYNTPFVGIGKEGAFNFFGKKVNKRTDLDASWTGGYFLDFASLTWFEIKLDWSSAIDKKLMSSLQPINIDLEDFQLMKVTGGWLIFQKSDQQLFHFSGEDLRIENPSFWIIEENSLTWKNFREDVQNIDVLDLVSRAEKVADVSIVPVQAEEVKTLQIQTILISLLFLGLVIILVVRLYHKRKIIAYTKPAHEEKVMVAEEEIEHDSLWKRILTRDEQWLSTAELDEFLEIQHLTPENRKAKRSRSIKALNERAKIELGKEIIFRERDADDKRFFRFRIEIKK